MAEIILRCGGKINLLSGDDAITYPIMAIGGTGVVSVTGNIVPKDVRAMITAIEKGDHKKARELHYRLLPLNQSMFIETNPMPVKEAMNMLGMGVGNVRLPLVRMLPGNLVKLAAALKDYGLEVKNPPA
jgi:4-hydroxy-tetrahydrodipicolinate synthase